MKEILSAEALAEIKRFNRNVEWLKNREIKKSDKWVKANIILSKTGWTRTELAHAKRNGYINYKGQGKSTTYDPSSINKDYLETTQKRHFVTQVAT